MDALKQSGSNAAVQHENAPLFISSESVQSHQTDEDQVFNQEEDTYLEASDAPANFSIQDVNAELIRKALEKHNGKRKAAAAELGISERTLYRKIKELGI